MLQEITLKGESKVPSYVLSCCMYKLPTTESLSASMTAGTASAAADSLFSMESKSPIVERISLADGLKKVIEFFKNFNFSALVKKFGTNIATTFKYAGSMILHGGSNSEYFLLPEVSSLFTEEQMNVIRQYIKIHKCASGNDLNEALASKNVIMIDDQALYPAYMLRQLQDRGCAVHTVSLQNQGD